MNIFDFINENKTDNNTIIFLEKSFDEVFIPNIFLPIGKKVKTFKDLAYYQKDSIVSQIKTEYRELFTNLLDCICKGYDAFMINLKDVITKTNGYDVLLKRASGERLEKIGIMKGLSRERVRQIEKSYSISILIYLVVFFQVAFHKGYFNDMLFINPKEVFSSFSEDEIKVIEFIIKKNKTEVCGNYFFYSDEFDQLVNIKKKSLYKNIINLIELNDCFNIYDCFSKLNDKLVYSYNVLDFNFDSFRRYLERKKYIIKGNLAIIPGNSKTNTIMVMVIKDYYKKGIELDKDGITSLEQKMKSLFGYDFKISSTISKIDELSPKLIIWGKQRRIHIDNVIITKDKSNEIIKKFEEIMNNSSYVLLDEVFIKMIDVLENTEIDSKYKLYGFLKYHLKDKYYFKKMAVRKLELKDYTLNELVYLYIDNHDMCLIDDIESSLDISLPSILSIIREDKSIVQIDNRYTIASKIRIDKNDLDLLKIFLDRSINQGFVHRDNLYNDYKDDFKKMNINDSQLLYHLCKYYFFNDYDFYIPYIQDKKYGYAITIKNIIYDYFKVHNGIIDIEKMQKDISYITCTKDFSLIYSLRSFDIKVFRMGYDRMALIENIATDKVIDYSVKTRIRDFFTKNSVAFENDIEILSKGLYYYVNSEKCYMNYYSFCSYVHNYIKDYYVINSLGINNYLTCKYAITNERLSYLELIYKEIRKEFKEKEAVKNDVLRFIREKRMLSSFASGFLNEYVQVIENKIIFKN